MEQNHCTIAALHEAFAHRRSTLTSILDRLERRGFVRRETHPDDRRSFLVRPTRSGRALASRVHETLDSLEARALRGVSPEELAGFGFPDGECPLGPRAVPITQYWSFTPVALGNSSGWLRGHELREAFSCRSGTDGRSEPDLAIVDIVHRV